MDWLAFDVSHRTWLAYHDKTASATSLLGFGMLVLLIANLDRIEYFKGFGLEAKTRELGEKIEQANRLLEELKRLSRLSGWMFIDLVCRQGRWDSDPGAQRIYDLKNEIEEQLKSVGVSEDEVRQAMEPWVKWTAFDLAAKASGELRSEFSRLERSATAERQVEVEAYSKRLQSLHLFGATDLKLAVEELLFAAPLVDPGRLEQIRARAGKWLSELEHLASHNDLPRQSALLAEPMFE